jgi:hypothetical protein
MSILVKNPITQLTFSVYENRGVFAVLLGSGLSRSAEIPTGWEINKMDAQERIDSVCRQRGLPDIAAGNPCKVDGKFVLIVDGNLK